MTQNNNLNGLKIKLEEPFKSKYKYGKLRLKPSGRKYISLYNSIKDRKYTTYARYLMGVKLGYEVPPEFEVDHKDDDFTNDDPDNLQLLTQEQNKQKYNNYFNNIVQLKVVYTSTNCPGLCTYKLRGYYYNNTDWVNVFTGADNEGGFLEQNLIYNYSGTARYIPIPQNTYLTNAYLNLSGFNSTR